MKRKDYLEIINQLNILTNRQIKVYHEVAKCFGLSDCELDILYCYAVDNHPRTQKELCDENCSTKQTIHSAIQKMEKKGLLRSSVGQNKREKLIELTAEGEELCDQTARILLEADYFVMKQFNATEVKRILDKYAIYTDAIVSKYEEVIHEQK